MGITKRLIDLARSNLNALVEPIASLGERRRDDGGLDDEPREPGLHEFTDDELRSELALREARRRADKAGHFRFALPKEMGGQAHPVGTGGNLAMAVIREHLAARGASFWADLLAALAARDLPYDEATVLDALWDLVWAGEVTNDSLAPLRSLLSAKGSKAGRTAAPVRGHGPSSNAVRAAPTARSTSCSEPAAAWAMTSSVCGEITSMRPPLPSCQDPPMNTWS